MVKTDEAPNTRKRAVRRTLLIGGAFILGFVVLAVLSIQAWEYTNSVSFCANTCHDVHPEEPAAYQDSYHARVKCTECHMGRVGTLSALGIKVSHNRHLPEVLLHNYERPLQSATMRPASESCERCHWPPAFHGDTVREITHFLPDEPNTEKATYLILKTGGGEREKGLGYGIHWHILNPVEYIAADPQKQEIRWVRTTLPDGRTMTYSDVTNPLTAEEIDAAQVRVMDCVDCHNRVGHPFPYPDQAIDQALAEGRLDPALPYVKQELSAVLGATYLDQAAALAQVNELEQTYQQTYPGVAAARGSEIAQATAIARELLPRLVFEEPGVTWQSFPDNSQHKVSAGCFRCHDGKHLSPDGESIRLHCNICHSIPVIVGGGDRPPQMPVATIQEPASHLDANYMANHRFQADGSCDACHGEVRFGSDDSSFCANSACHGQEWPSVELDAAFPHPIPLEGKHAAVWCHKCHEGQAKPEYRCANCHQPPALPHFGDECEQCHQPAGFDQVNLAGFQHPIPLVGRHREADCLACHGTGFKPAYQCESCHQPPDGHFARPCDQCHTPEWWTGPANQAISAAPRIPHSMEERENCTECHATARLPDYEPFDHTAFGPPQCTLCHAGRE